MADIKVRKLEDWVINVHQQLAMRSKDSLENYLRKLLTDAALKSQHEFADYAEKHLTNLRKKYGTLPSDTIHEERWEQG